MPMTGRAVVIGGSVGGLAAAAMLASRAREVVVIERRLPEHGSVAPQGQLPHVMLAPGSRVLEQLFPGFSAALLSKGAFEVPGTDKVPCYWVAAGARRDHLVLPSPGFPRAMCSRALIEDRLRERVTALANVRVEQGNVVGLAVAGTRDGEHRVTGVHVRGGDTALSGDVVVDAGGRGSCTSEWLRAAGAPGPTVDEVVVDVRYTAFVVERRPDDFAGGVAAVVQNTRRVPRIGVAVPLEGDRWHVLLGGYFGDAAPTDPAGAARFAASLCDPVLAELVERPHLSKPTRYTFKSSRRQRWERLSRPPRGLYVVGDAVASFNPIYGQGMTSALLQVQALGEHLDQHGTAPGTEGVFARRAARVVDNPWLVATGADLAYPQARGRRPLGNAPLNRYVERVARAAATDDVVNAVLTAVQQLDAPPTALFRLPVLARTLRSQGSRRSRQAATGPSSVA
jgi:2-polyprenyl-6-methoxyphenol hydroxylase-like FAD-dependent oxidoreductase